MKVKRSEGSISPADWDTIVNELGDSTVKPANIEWWRTWTNWAQPEEGYQDTDYVALGRISYRVNPERLWFAVHAGCDTSGWGCYGDYAWVTYHKTYEDAVTNGLTKESRRWLGLELEGEE